MALDFNRETQKLAIKTEYAEADPIKVCYKIRAYAGVILDYERTFDPKTTPDSDYQAYYYDGFDFVFDIVDIA